MMTFKVFPQSLLANKEMINLPSHYFACVQVDLNNEFSETLLLVQRVDALVILLKKWKLLSCVQLCNLHEL